MTLDKKNQQMYYRLAIWNRKIVWLENRRRFVIRRYELAAIFIESKKRPPQDVLIKMDFVSMINLFCDDFFTYTEADWLALSDIGLPETYIID